MEITTIACPYNLTMPCRDFYTTEKALNKSMSNKRSHKILELNFSSIHEMWDGKWYSTVLLPLLGEGLCNSFGASLPVTYAVIPDSW